MLKVFISQPMRGKPDKEIRDERERAIEIVKKICGEDAEIIDSFFEGAPVSANPLWFFGKSIQLLSTADVAYFVTGWEKARGCSIEHTCAIEYGMNIIEEGDFDDEDEEEDEE